MKKRDIGVVSSVFACALALSACAAEPSPDKSQYAERVVSQSEHGALDGVLDVQASGDLVEGSFFLGDAEVRFESRILETSSETTIEVRGMILLLTADHQTGVFDVDGFAAENALDTQMTDADRAVITAFDRALGGAELDADLPAVEFLVRSLTTWGQYSSSLPLTRTFYGRLDRSSSLCSSVNKPGQGAGTEKFKRATHDCNDTAGDCSNWWGCDRWDDNSSTDKVFMSMHPGGGCSDDTYFGGSSSSFSCYEPDHPGGTEYAYGGCFGRCGGGCGSGTQFTRDCLDHDQCVRLGHALASFWCDDELVGATWDAINASNCSGVKFTVDYNWAGSSREGNCPDSWNGDNECDHGCQFIDGDCFR